MPKFDESRDFKDLDLSQVDFNDRNRWGWSFNTETGQGYIVEIVSNPECDYQPIMVEYKIPPAIAYMIMCTAQYEKINLQRQIKNLDKQKESLLNTEACLIKIAEMTQHDTSTEN